MPVLNKVKFFDSTLRDGSHAVKQKIYPENIEAYCKRIDDAGMHTVIVGHGNGIGAYSVQMGFCAIDVIEMLRIEKKNLRHTKLGTFVTVGFGTRKAHIVPAFPIITDGLLMREFPSFALARMAKAIIRRTSGWSLKP